MSSKRKQSSLGLERRVRARREDDWEPEPGSEGESSQDDLSEERTGGDDDDDNSSSAASDDESESELESDDSDADENAPHVNLSSVSFGALARAQASLPPPNRRSKKASADDTPATDKVQDEAAKRGGTKKAEAKPTPKRSSKHAPQEQTSKRPVSRRREILADPRRKHRDPRFDPLVGSGHLDESQASKAYAFLDEYRDSEMADLRAQIKKTKDADAKERLKRQLMSMESRRKATRKKHDEEALLREHRRHEKELVAQGKKPFYLKKREQKERLLTKRYEGMSKGQVDKAIARKRKKVAGKEKKELDSLERVRDRH
ncbi:rRNA biogenesis protein RRP36 domain-containing protein [Hirsutella rhossiliensis]|uniref:rRNA biogenesis protein RRP36 n=1 Tax=Hirsutella rhossiliensis TaxID=111463 RepID=A0A9P8N128_9HYPO|nr:rRNA biogenesis protein RRP36 domain-containing protein [Hirsutella rhossiliensis]KAH0964945.1 rRNA biogenesis protein RRP36 domain-containing protein [Hirsutella rhossiliensis]